LGGANRVDVYIEAGAKRAFAGALDWPGWSRSGRDEQGALEALAEYRSRYAAALRGSRLGFTAPPNASAFRVKERLKGNATTAFGAPGIPPKADGRPVDDADLRRFERILRASWRTFDRTVENAAGRPLTKGPRGGGRDLKKIVEHVRGADEGYLRALGAKDGGTKSRDPKAGLSEMRKAILDALPLAASGAFGRTGPRGGVRWTVRYYVRRSAWHVLDHAWEIEDRTIR